MSLTNSSVDVLDNWDEDVLEVNVNESFEELEQSLITLLSETDASNNSCDALNTGVETKASFHTIDSDFEIIGKDSIKKEDTHENCLVIFKNNVVTRPKRVLKRPHFDAVLKPIECKRLKSKTDGLACSGKKRASHDEDTAPILDQDKGNLNSLGVGEAYIGTCRSSNKTSVINSSPEDHNKENCVSVCKLASKTKSKQQIKLAFENIANVIPAKSVRTHKVPTGKNEIQIGNKLDEKKVTNFHQQMSEKSLADSSDKFGNTKSAKFTQIQSSPEILEDSQEGVTTKTAVSKDVEQLVNSKSLKLSEMESAISELDDVSACKALNHITTETVASNEAECHPASVHQKQVELSSNSQVPFEACDEQDSSKTVIYELEHSEVPCVTPLKPCNLSVSSPLSSKFIFTDNCEQMPSSPGKMVQFSTTDMDESSSPYSCTQSIFTISKVSNVLDAVSDENSENLSLSLNRDASCCPTPKSHLNCLQCNQNLRQCICHVSENSENEQLDVLQKFDVCSQTPKMTSFSTSKFVSSTPVTHEINIANNINCNDLSAVEANSDGNDSIKLDCDKEENYRLNELSFEHWLKSGSIEAQLNASKELQKEMHSEVLAEDEDMDEVLEATLMEFNIETLRDIVNSEKSLNDTGSEVCYIRKAEHDKCVEPVNKSFQSNTKSNSKNNMQNQDKAEDEHLLSMPKEEISTNPEFVVIDEETDDFIRNPDVEEKSGKKCSLNFVESHEDVTPTELVKYSATVEEIKMPNKPEMSSNRESEGSFNSIEDRNDHMSNKAEYSVSVEVIEVSDETERSFNPDGGELEHALATTSGSSEQEKALEVGHIEEKISQSVIEKDKVSACHYFKDAKTVEVETVPNCSVNVATSSVEVNEAECPEIKLSTVNLHKIKEFQSTQSSSNTVALTKDKCNSVNEFKTAPKTVLIPESSSALLPEVKDSKQIGQIQEDNKKIVANEPKVEKVQPVIYPEEHKDIDDPDWDIIKKLDTDEKRYKQVRSRWMSRNIPDPNQNLTTHSFRKKQALMETKFKHSPILPPINRGHKRSASEKHNNHNNKRARTKTVPCTYIIDSKIESVERQFNATTKRAADDYFSQIRVLSEQQENLEHSKWRQEQNIHSYQYYRYPFYDTYVNAMSAATYNMMMIQNETKKNRLQFDHEQKVSEARRKYDSELNALREAREEISKFCSFYKGLNGKNDENDPTLITESQLQELNEIENIYEQFKYHYYDPNK